MIRTNLLTNPRYIGNDTLNGSWGGTPIQEDMATGAPDGGGYTKITLTADQTGSAYVSGQAANEVPASEGDELSFSSYFYRPREGHVDVRLQWRDASDALISQSIQTLEVTTPDVGEWVRCLVTGTAPAGTAKAWVVSSFTNATLLNGDEVGVAMRMLGDDGDYFDGGSPSPSPLIINTWLGEINNSMSTQTITEISAELLTTSAPQPVQVLVADLPPGTAYEVIGVGPSGRSWGIPGGTGISDGDQVRLVDRRAPVNVPVHYEVQAAQTSLNSNEVTITWAPEEGLEYVLIQSLDGSEVVPVRKWMDNGLPDTYGIRSTTFDVHGRSRPVVVLSGATEGTTPVQVVLSRQAGEQLEHILKDLGGAVCLRTDTKLRDLPPSDLAVMTTASSVLYSGDGGVGTARTWDVGLTWIDDPEPDTVPVVWTVDDVDTLLGITLGLTVDQVDAMFAGLTVDDVDATDWGSLG